jgi:hypothetical protein
MHSYPRNNTNILLYVQIYIGMYVYFLAFVCLPDCALFLNLFTTHDMYRQTGTPTMASTIQPNSSEIIFTLMHRLMSGNGENYFLAENT